MRFIDKLRMMLRDLMAETYINSKHVWTIKFQWLFYIFLKWINVRIRRLTFVKKIFFKKFDVLLLNPPKTYEPVKHFPIGIASIATYLQKNGVNIFVIDMNSQYIREKLLKIVLKLYKPRLVGLSAITCQADYAYKLGRFIKDNFPKIKLVYGGVHPSALPKEPFERGRADFVIICEGEQTILELYKTLKYKDNLSRIAGLVYKDKTNKIRINKPRNTLQNLDELPMLQYNLFDINSYDTDIHIYPYNRKIAMDLMTSRGCPHNCDYCASPFLYKRKVRFRSAEKIIEEIQFLMKNYKFKYFHFHDDDFLLNTKRIKKLCNLIIDNKLNIKFICLTNANTLLRNQKILPTLKKAGCIGIEFGIESINKEVLANINKTQDTKNFQKLATILKKVKITPMYLVMSFNPGETLNSAYETSKSIYKLTEGKNNAISFYLQAHHYNFCLGMLTTPYPGSKLFKTANDKGKILVRKYSDYRPENINFIPNTFLNDIPIQTNKLSFLDFSNLINRKYKKNILYHPTGGFNIFLNKHDFNFNEYVKFLFSLYSKCNGKVCIKEISDLIMVKYPNTNMGYDCAGLRFLAMFGLIRSNKQNNNLKL